MRRQRLPALFYLESKPRLAYHLPCPPLGSLGFTFQVSIILTETPDSKRAFYFPRVPISDLGLCGFQNVGGKCYMANSGNTWDRRSESWPHRRRVGGGEGHLLGDHVHMLISIPPKYAVAQVVGFFKGKSAIPI